MKSLGKNSVITRSFSDGTLIRTSSSNRVVYEDKQGDFFINHLEGKKKIKKTNEGYVAEYHSRSIVSNTAQDVINEILNKAQNTGGPVRIFGFSDK